MLALAPDAAAARAALGLARPVRWSGCGHDDQAAWGSCRGSGKEPYLTEVALADGASRCSCPSRKFPCKHALGLLFLLAEGGVPAGSPPDRVRQWLAARRARATAEPRGPERRPAEGGPGGRAAADPAAAARRAASRDAKVDAGTAELDRWLADLVRTGLGAAQSRPWSWWDEQARRMIDAQARGLAAQVRRMAAIAATAGHRTGWPDRLTDQIGSAHLLCAARAHQDALTEPVRAALRVRLGYTVPAEEVAASGERVSDNWSVLGERTSDDGNLRTLQQWLYGERSGQVTSFLSFGAGGQEPSPGLPRGRRTEATLALYPGTQPARALIAERHGDGRPLGVLPAAPDWDAALERAARWLCADPWADVLPLAVGGLTVLPADPGSPGEPWLLRDAAGLAMPVAGGEHVRWALLALCGGRPADVAGEWDGFVFTPQAAAPAGRPGGLLTGSLTGWPAEFRPAEFRAGGDPAAGLQAGQGGWSGLVHVAVLGTGRAELASAGLPDSGTGETGGSRGSGGAEPPAEDVRFLDAAAMLSRARRAGYRPEDAAARPAPEPARADPRAAVSQAAQERLAGLLVSGAHELAAEWLRNLAGRRPPDALLPALLTAAGQDAGLRSGLRPAGPRAWWLADLNQEWSWCRGAAAGARPADARTGWETGTSAGRRELLAALRASDPAAGRELVMSTWDSDSYRDRAAFASLLVAGLSAADEPLAELALADRRSEVRQAGAGLLARLAESAWSRRAAARAAAAVRVSRGPVRTTLSVTPPAAAADLAADQLDVTPPRGTSPADWLLRQVVAAAPAGFWAGHTGLAPAQLLALAGRSEWQGPLRAGWSAAAVRDSDTAWLTALLDAPGAHRDVTEELALFAALPPAVRDDWLRANPGSPLFGPALAQFPPPWSEPLSDVVRTVIAGVTRSDPGRSPAPRALLRLAAMRLEPPVPPPVAATEVHDRLAVSWASLESTLSERAAMRRELAEELTP